MKHNTTQCQTCGQFSTRLVNNNKVTLNQCAKEVRLNKPDRWDELEKPKDCVKPGADD